MRIVLALILLSLTSGCTYDLFDDTYDAGSFEMDEVVGTFRGERVSAAPGQTNTVPATATISLDGAGAATIRIEFGGLVEEYIGTYNQYGFSVYGDGADGASFNWYVDGDGFITGSSYGFPDSERREFTGRMTKDHFDLLIRSPDGTVRDDLRTSR